MKKLLVLLGSIGLTSTAAIGVVACGVKNRSEVNKINLSDLELNLTIQGTENMTTNDAFAAFLANNQDKNLDSLRESVTLSFIKSDYDNNGSLVITAQPNSKYTGSIEIIILAMKQIALSSLNQDNLDGEANMTKAQAFAAFLANNRNINDLEQYVDVIFNAPDYDNNGSLVITAQPNTKYTGVITVVINKMKKTGLIDLLNAKDPSKRLVTSIDGTEAMIGDDSGRIALATFFEINKENYPDLVDNIEITSYNNKVGYNQNGFLYIQGIKKYSGGTSIFIRNIPVTDEKIVDTIINSYLINFSATKALDQSLDDFINGVLRGGEHDDSHWYIKGQIELYKKVYPILNYIDYNKYEFTGFYLLDETTPLTDAYLKANAEVGKVMKLRAKFNYGTVQAKFIDFSLSFQPTKN